MWLRNVPHFEILSPYFGQVMPSPPTPIVVSSYSVALNKLLRAYSVYFFHGYYGKKSTNLSDVVRVK